MKTQLKLLFITIITLVLSGYLFWSGLTQEGKLLPLQPKPTPQTPTINVSVDEAAEEGTQSTPSSQEQNSVKVTKVVDGDTVEVEIEGVKKKLRYIGVNTPETVDPRRVVQCFGKEASNENKRLVEGKNIYLEKDVSETDKFNRLLRYIYLKLDDGSLLFVNDYLVRQGFANASEYPPDIKYSDRFREAEREARENKRGLWGKCVS